MDYIDYWKKNHETELVNTIEKFEEEFNISLNNSRLYFPMLYKFSKNSQLKYWDREVFSVIKNKVREIENQLGVKKVIDVLLENLDLFVSMFEGLKTIEDRIVVMNKFRGSEEMRAKIFIVSIWNDLLNTSYSDNLKLLIKFYGEVARKNQDQKNLTPQIEYLSKRGFRNITDLSDVDIRNAISHGGVRYDSNGKIFFSFSQGQKYGEKTISYFNLITNLKEIFDATSAMCLFWISYLCEKNIDYFQIKTSENASEKVKNFFEKISFSTLFIECTSLNEIELNGKGLSVNIEFNHPNLEINSRYIFGIQSALKIYRNRSLSDKDSVFIAFHSTRTMNSFFRISGRILNELVSNKIDFQKAILKIAPDSMMWGVNDEPRNETDDLFRYYEDIETEEYCITEISDISLEDTKRFSAVLYLKGDKNKFNIRKLIKDATNQLKQIENYGFTSNKVKHGSMNADILYLTVYKNEIRRGKNRELYPDNDNFVVYVQYDIDKKFPIRNNFVDSLLQKNREANLEFNWNPNYK